LSGISRKRESDQAAIAVALGAQPFSPEQVAVNKRLQCVATVIGDLDCRQPQFAAIVEQQRAAIADSGDICRADGGQLALLLRCRIAHHGGACSDA
jgi:hypothetical protein